MTLFASCVYYCAIQSFVELWVDHYLFLRVLQLNFEIFPKKPLQIISPYNLYLNPKLVVKHYQFWRLITNFLYFRKMGNLFLTLDVFLGMLLLRN